VHTFLPSDLFSEIVFDFRDRHHALRDVQVARNILVENAPTARQEHSASPEARRAASALRTPRLDSRQIRVQAAPLGLARLL
jgi:hypothetical protein